MRPGAATGFPGGDRLQYTPAVDVGSVATERFRAMRRRLAGLFVIGLIALAAAADTGIQAAVLPKVSLGDLVVTEPSGRSGTASVAWPIVLVDATHGPVVIGWRTVAGTAGTADFVADSGSLTITAGSQGGGICARHPGRSRDGGRRVVHRRTHQRERRDHR